MMRRCLWRPRSRVRVVRILQKRLLLGPFLSIPPQLRLPRPVLHCRWQLILEVHPRQIDGYLPSLALRLHHPPPSLLFLHQPPHLICVDHRRRWLLHLLPFNPRLSRPFLNRRCQLPRLHHRPPPRSRPPHQHLALFSHRPHRTPWLALAVSGNRRPPIAVGPITPPSSRILSSLR